MYRQTVEPGSSDSLRTRFYAADCRTQVQPASVVVTLRVAGGQPYGKFWQLPMTYEPTSGLDPGDPLDTAGCWVLLLGPGDLEARGEYVAEAVGVTGSTRAVKRWLVSVRQQPWRV